MVALFGRTHGQSEIGPNRASLIRSAAPQPWRATTSVAPTFAFAGAYAVLLTPQKNGIGPCGTPARLVRHA